MISLTPFGGKPAPDLPRRDLVAIFPYLNRKELEARSRRAQTYHVECRLQRLAAASRMQ